MNPFHVFMSGWGWALFSLVAAVFLGGFFLVNQYLKKPGHLLVFWMRVIVVLALSPYVAHIKLPADPRFYLVILVTVLVGTVSDIRTFNACTLYGGGVVSRVQPLTVVGTFVLWFLFDPHLFGVYAAHPLNTLGVLLSLGGTVFFAMRLEKCPVTRAAFVYMIPALAGYTLTNALNKYAMGLGPLEGAVYGYMYIQSIIAVVIIGGYAAYRERQAEKAAAAVPWANREMVAAALLAALCWLCHMIYKNYAMAFTPNPSYQVAITLTAPVFIAVFYRFAQHREEADVASGMGVVGSAALLALMTAH